MNYNARPNKRRRATASGFTMVEMMVSVGIGVIVLGFATIFFINGLFSFAAIANYQNLDAKSTVALDTYSKEIRNATAVVTYVNGVSFTLTNATAATATTIAYDATAHTVVMTKTGQAAKTNLTGCDLWSFSLYNRIPDFSSTNSTSTATNAAQCKLISMTWKCSRTIFGSKLNTESVQTAKVVLRNKVN